MVDPPCMTLRRRGFRRFFKDLETSPVDSGPVINIARRGAKAKN